MVVALGIHTEHWGLVKHAFPGIHNCCIDVTRAFRRESDEDPRRPNDMEPCHRLMIMPLNYLLPERIYRLSALWRQRGDETMEHVSTEFRGDAGTHRGATPSALESTR